jgi:Flp pilus assembly protein TadG
MLRTKPITRLLRDSSGSVAILGALAAPVLLMLAGGAVDMQRTESARVRMQDALDAAVVAGLTEGDGGDEAAAQQAFTANKDAGVPNGVFNLDNAVMTGSVRSAVPTTFLQVIGVSSLPINAVARARIGDAQTPCVLLTEPTERALTANAGASLNASSCPVHVNSNHATEAVVTSTGAVIRTESFCSVGGVRRNQATITPPANTGCAVLQDPLANVPEPVVPGTCEDRVANGPGAIVRLPAGRCWRNVTASSGGRIVFEPGVHKITGLVKGSNASTVTGSGVTLFFEGAAAKLDASSNSTLTLSAPSTGPTAGVVMFQGRTGAAADNFVVSADVTASLEGVVYLPRATIELNSDVTTRAAWTMLIIRKMILNSSARMTVNSNFNAGPPAPRAMRPIYLEQ